MSINRIIQMEGLLFSKLDKLTDKRFKKCLASFQSRLGGMPTEIHVNEESDFECEILKVVKRKNVLKNHFMLVKN